MSPEAYRKMFDTAVARGLQDGQPAKPKLTSEQLCLERAIIRRHIVAEQYAAKFKAKEVRPSYNEVIEEVYPLLRQEFANWSKEDFATLACMLMAINAAETLREADFI